MENRFTHKVVAYNDTFSTTVFYGTKSEAHMFVADNKGKTQVSGVESELEVQVIKSNSDIAYAIQLRGQNFYYKLWACLNKSMSTSDLEMHANNIIIHLAKSIESQAAYYDQTMDAWCDYFMK